jgi:DUF4097 and DUF4098 domain-containing protein YvlB
MRLIAVTAFALVGCLAGCMEIGAIGPSDRFQSDFHYMYGLDANGTVDADIYNGSIEIQGADTNQIEISGVKYGATEELRDAVKVDVQHSPQHVEIHVSRPSGGGNSGARITLRVPRKAGAAGTYRVRTSNGRIEARDLNGLLDAHTSNGRIQAEGIDGRVETGTSNGSIEIRLAAAPRDDIRATTSNGAIKVHVPESTNARVTASTTNGHVRTDFGLEGRQHIEGVIGKGGPHIDLSTTNGGIDIQRN